MLCVAMATTMGFNVIFSKAVAGWPSLALSQAGFLVHSLSRYWLSTAVCHSLGSEENLMDQARSLSSGTSIRVAAGTGRPVRCMGKPISESGKPSGRHTAGWVEEE